LTIGVWKVVSCPEQRYISTGLQINDNKTRTIDELVVYDISARLIKYAMGGVDVSGISECHGRRNRLWIVGNGGRVGSNRMY
jgi:hypothetical protein